MDEDLKKQFAWLEERAAARDAAMREHVEAVETRLLGEFWKWARTADARYRMSDGMISGMRERLLVMEDRISELERKAS